MEIKTNQENIIGKVNKIYRIVKYLVENKQSVNLLYTIKKTLVFLLTCMYCRLEIHGLVRK